MLTSLYSKTIKGYAQLNDFCKILDDLEYLYFKQWQKDSKTWKIYYHHWNKNKNIEIKDMIGEIRQ